MTMTESDVIDFSGQKKNRTYKRGKKPSVEWSAVQSHLNRLKFKNEAEAARAIGVTPSGMKSWRVSGRAPITVALAFEGLVRRQAQTPDGALLVTFERTGPIARRIAKFAEVEVSGKRVFLLEVE